MIEVSCIDMTVAFSAIAMIYFILGLIFPNKRTFLATRESHSVCMAILFLLFSIALKVADTSVLLGW